MIRGLKSLLRPYWTLHLLLKGKVWLPDELASGRLVFSQFGEDLLLESMLEAWKTDAGFYVDVGAFHPVRYSNTYLFYKKGWRGINIEPNPESFASFDQKRKRDINLNIAISPEPGMVDFICDGEYSGIRDETYLDPERAKAARTVKVRTFPLAEILEEHLPEGTSIDFLSVDCEGHDLQVLMSNDWTRFRPRIVLVETHGDAGREKVGLLMSDAGYTQHGRLGFTSFYLNAR